MSARVALAVVIVALAPAADADVWQRASDPTAATADEVYERALATGDDLARQANAQASISLQTIRSDVQLAINAYHAAASAEPARAEPYFRIGWMLYSFYFECSAVQPSLLCDPSPGAYNRKVAQQVIDAWDAAEQRAPLDPRFSGITEGHFGMLFDRAVLNTKFADDTHLELAARDYRALIARSDGAGLNDGETVMANLAETYMMLGKLDDAIDLYREAVRRGSEISTTFGLAIALDRDGSVAEARALIVRLGASNYEEFKNKVRNGESFYVPAGEVYYYLAVAEDAFGDTESSVEYWNRFLQSGAHPQFQPRARANRDALLAKLHSRPPPPPSALDLGF